ncbi:MAG: LSU ribosomal protein L2p (L8e) [uncultured Phycisphaerae bacterium]|uniref:Large ribosomal subunit protein uL2 n=1 Tax=uncultured Phycisphaerae bacterium TaxID=904963 RepID=A0A6J4QQ13_9BACT|nr:MAG: LSU ribosomal protein L2p (L8e) [uncultured Phycisphaerae bacterium]
MPIKFYNPTSAGRRAGSVLDYKAVITKTEPEKSLTVGKRRASGRNHHGVITAKHHGGGNKRLYRIIDFKRNSKDGIPARVEAIEYDPNRSCNIALIRYEDGDKAYILAPNGLNVGATITSGPNSEPELGNCLPLANIPGGLEVHNIEMNPGQGGKLVRSAGGVARLGAKEGDWAVIILPSGEMRRVRSACRATIGQIGNLDWINVSLGKAGRSRHRGIRPHTRAKAMNPIDHPLGGGEGRSNGGRHPVSKTGVPSKGGITRSKKKHSEKLILRRRKFGKHQVRPQTVNV